MRYRSFENMPLVLTVRDVADTLEIGRNQAYDLVNSGQICSIRVGNQIRVLRDSFIHFLTNSVVQSA